MECKPSTTIVALGELGITVFQQWHQVHFLVGISATPPCLRRQGRDFRPWLLGSAG